MAHKVLSKINAHPRDVNIRFFEKGHKYQILTDMKSRYTSVTTWNHSHFPKFDADKIIECMMKGKNWGPDNKYWGMSPQQIKDSWNTNRDAVAGAGTDMHYEIECFMNNPSLPNHYTHQELYAEWLTQKERKTKDDSSNETDEWDFFIQFVKEHPELKPYRTEWMIYDEEVKIAGSIDMIYENPDGTLSIYDWKRSKEITTVNNWNKFATNSIIDHLPDSNFWHYALQLNTYKKILETRYGKQIKDMYLVRIHPSNPEKTYELINVPSLENELEALFQERKEKIQ